ncbi:MAG: hypothetical protein AB7T38_11755 [Nitrospirales bacterium]
MQRQLDMKVISVGGLLMIGLMGCGVWPIMNEENGKRPFAMGKSDQVFLPEAPRPVHLSEDFGVAYRQSVEGQILNPAASNNLEQVPGAADPQALKYSLSRYQLGFKTPPFSEWELTESSSTSSTSGGGSPKTGGTGGKK